MDETFKAALRASLHRWVDEALDSEHGDVDLSRQESPSCGDIWHLKLRWLGRDDGWGPELAAVANDERHSASDRSRLNPFEG